MPGLGWLVGAAAVVADAVDELVAPTDGALPSELAAVVTKDRQKRMDSWLSVVRFDDSLSLSLSQEAEGQKMTTKHFLEWSNINIMIFPQGCCFRSFSGPSTPRRFTPLARTA